jgi:hypothetical protein
MRRQLILLGHIGHCYLYVVRRLEYIGNGVPKGQEGLTARV